MAKRETMPGDVRSAFEAWIQAGATEGNEWRYLRVSGAFGSALAASRYLTRLRGRSTVVGV